MSERIPSYQFPDVASQILKQSVKDEIQRVAQTKLFSKTDLRNNLNRESNFTISNPYYDSNDRRAYVQGTEKIISITFLPTDYINQFGQKTQTPRLDIDICAVGISLSKNIIKTDLINEKGTIKEIVSQPDYSVAIAGVLIGYFKRPTAENPMQAKPLGDMMKLKEIAESKISVKVTSDVLNMYGIQRLSIENLNMPSELSDINIQKFSMTAFSDSDDLVII